MNTLFVPSTDECQIAYDVCGEGPAVVLVHGGGSNRQDWHTDGYVSRLKRNFKVICVDLRGHGESGLPTGVTDYRINQMAQDLLAVVDACGIEVFTIWGFSYGGKVSRYLAAHSERVSKLIMMSTSMGPPVTESIRNEIETFCRHWMPILNEKTDGSLNPRSLSHDDQKFLDSFDVPVMMAWGRAMLDWPYFEPDDFRCPALWLVGSEDSGVIPSVKKYQNAVEGTEVRLKILDGLSHEQVFEDIDLVFDLMVSFTLS